MTKRGNGAGSVYKRSDGRWTAKLTLADGSRRQLYAKTQHDVQELLTKELRDRKLGTLTSGGRTMVAQFLARWLDDLQLRPLTISSYRQKATRHIIPAIGHIQIEALTPAHVNALLRAKEREGHSPQNVAQMRAVLRAALSRAVRWNLVTRNVAALADPPRIEQYEAHYLTPEQAKRFLEAARGDRLEALYSVALTLGLRQGAALGLRWDAIDLDAKTLRIERALQRLAGSGLQLVEPKTKRSRRTLSMPDVVMQALRTHRARQNQERLFAGTWWVDSGLVFTTLEGRPLGASHVVSGSFRRICDRAGIAYGTATRRGLRFPISATPARVSRSRSASPRGL